MNFGEFVKNKRLAIGLSLRKFCDIAEIDPSNWSKIERDRLPVTDDRDQLEKIAKVLNLKIGEKDWQKFFDLAYISKGIIPKYVYSDEEVLNALPVFFRTARGEKPSQEELDKLLDLLKRR